MALEEVCVNHKTHSLEIVPGPQHWLETNKLQAYNIFTSRGVKMPECVFCFDSERQLIKNLPSQYPYVIKFNNLSHSGLQTLVMKSTADFKWFYKYKKMLGDFNFVDKTVSTTLNGLVQKFIPAESEYTTTILMNRCNWQTVGTANDYKKLLDGDLGPNTNSMGSISPAKQTHPDTNEQIDKIVSIIRNETDYQGFVSCQFLVDFEKNLWFLEANIRLCNPEFQSMAVSLDCALLDRIAECQENRFIQPVDNTNNNAVTVVLMPKNWDNTADFEHDTPWLTSDRFKIYNSIQDGGRISITNHHASRTHAELAAEIYHYLDSVDITGYTYRKDIGVDPG
jgi:phosphoribosylamine-glycine ligase